MNKEYHFQIIGVIRDKPGHTDKYYYFNQVEQSIYISTMNYYQPSKFIKFSKIEKDELPIEIKESLDSLVRTLFWTHLPKDTKDSNKKH
jgi:hypothetical protein